MAAAIATPDVSVIIVSYNAIDWLRRCLHAVGNLDTALDVEIIVVDNLSDTPVRDYLATAPYGITPHLLAANVGFGRACNFGASKSRGRYVLMLNPDAVIEPKSVDVLAEFCAEDPRRGLVGGRTLREDGSLDPSSCWGAPSVWSYFCLAVGLTTVFRRSPWFDPESLGGWERDSVREVDIVSGCLLMSSRETWDELGGFDPDFFMYGEDADLSLRAWKAGFRPSITPGATAVHALSATTGTKLAKHRLLLRGKASYVRKNWTPARAAAGIGLLKVGTAIRAGGEVLLRRHNDTMRTLWSERRNWSQGWPPHV